MFFSTKTLKKIQFIFYSPFQFGLATFQVLSSHVWQVATILDNARLGSIYNLQEIQGTEERVRTLRVCIQQKPD